MTNNRTARIAASVVIALAMISSAAAQTTDSKACSQQERSNQTLAEELGQSNGVICPAEVDPGIKEVLAPFDISGRVRPAMDLGATLCVPVASKSTTEPNGTGN
jgi:hypothetical protein